MSETRAAKLESILIAIWFYTSVAIGWVYTKIVAGLKRLNASFWDVWMRPMTYPIIIAVSFTTFMIGHAEGRRPAKTLLQATVALRSENARLTNAVKTARTEAADAEDRAKTAEAKLLKPSVAKVADPASPATLVKHSAKPKTKVEPAATGWAGLFKF